MANPVVTASLVRTGDGHVVHRADCLYITRFGDTSRAVPWEWATGRPVSEVSRAVSKVDSRCCRICRPMSNASA